MIIIKFAILFFGVVELLMFYGFMKFCYPTPEQSEYQFYVTLIRLYIMASIICLIGALK